MDSTDVRVSTIIIIAKHQDRLREGSAAAVVLLHAPANLASMGALFRS